MAPAERPAIVLDDDAKTATYQALDAIDEALYNDDLRWRYEKACFQNVITTHLAEIAAGNEQPFQDGNAIRALWTSKRTAARINKWKKIPRKYAPLLEADPPVEEAQEDQPSSLVEISQTTESISSQASKADPPVEEAQEDQPSSLVEISQTTESISSQASKADPPVEEAQEDRSSSTVEAPPTPKNISPQIPPQTPKTISPQTPGSSDSLAPISPLYVLTNRDHDLIPTVGERKQVREDMRDESWKFARVLYQSDLFPGSGSETTKVTAHQPRKNVLLYVKPNAQGLIEDRIAVKRVDISKGDEDYDNTYWAKNEIEINRLFAKTKCSHILQYRGDGERKTKKRALEQYEDTSTRQHKKKSVGKPVIHHMHILQLYSEYASYGDLDELVRAHDARRVPVPEHFIWYLISEMVEVLYTFQQGRCNQPHAVPSAGTEFLENSDSEETSDAWTPLLHSDIKNENIFCSDGNVKFPSYPRAVVADFDIVQRSDDATRFSGTIRWQPPERNILANEANQEKDYDLEKYVPAKWEISVKAELWAIGAVAYRLMLTGSAGASERWRIEMYEESKSWLTRFFSSENNQITSTTDLGGYFQTLGEETDMYSSGLIRLVQRCLRYRPEERPELLEMKKLADANLERLNKLYGGEVGKTKDKIGEPHKVWLTAVIDRPPPFAIGSEYKPRRKRPRIELDDDRLEIYQAIVTKWVVDMSAPQPDIPSQARIVDAMYDMATKSRNKTLRQFFDNESFLYSFRYLITCLRHRVDPEGIAYYTRNWLWNRNDIVLRSAVTMQVQKEVLDHIESMISEFRSGRAYRHLQGVVDVLEHVVAWSNQLLQFGCEPIVPELSSKTELHRAFRDWIFVHPHQKRLEEDSD